MTDFENMTPEIHPKTFVAEGARLIGRVILKEGASIWYNAVLRADLAEIVIGENSNVQDNCVFHVEHGQGTLLGRNVTVGHGAILHACRIGDNTLVGMGAIVLDGSVIPAHSLVGAGSVVPPNKTYQEGSLLLGSPARFVRKLSPQEIEDIAASARHYREFWESYLREGIPVISGGPDGR
jgi:carbonic anhydrase/acetyltransferase-like protein (isoleucine patch superfamily)